jgi:hypothetical protein
MIERPLEFILGLVAGASLGVVLDELLGVPLRRALRWFPRRHRVRSAQTWEGANRDAVEVFQTWSAANVLLEEHVLEHWDALELARVSTSPNIDQVHHERVRALFRNPDDFDRCVASLLEGRSAVRATTNANTAAASDPTHEDMAPLTGAPEFTDSWVANLSECVPRWRESRRPSEEKLHLRLTPMRYVETFAVELYAQRHPEEWAKWQEAIRRPRESLPTLPPGTFWVSISVTSLEGHLLAWRRSGNVTSARGLWTIGTDETMKPPSPEAGHGPSGLFELARRSLREEVGLEPSQYNDEIFFSSIGIRRAAFHLPRLAIGHIWCDLPAAEIEGEWLKCESANEHTDVTWIPSDEATLRAIAAGAPVKVGARVVGPDWLYTNWLLAVGRWSVHEARSGRR